MARDADQALAEAQAVLTALLPHYLVQCSVSSKREAEEIEPDRHSMVALRCADRTSSARYEWSIPDHPAAPKLSLSLQDPNSAADHPEARELGDRVVRLLSLTLERQREEQLGRERAQRTERLFERALQVDKLAQYGQVVAGVLHDLNSPITAILSYTDYLEQTLPHQGCQSKDLERLARIREAAQRVLENTRTLLRYARPAATQSVVVHLEEILRKALAFCDHELSRAKVSTALNVEPSAAIVGVPGQLVQLFVNLFTNAAHAAHPTGGQLRVDCRHDDEPQFVLVRVADHGAGIRRTDLEHVFEPFFTTKTDGSGFGLGLSIVQDIVHRHGGRISVESKEHIETVFSVWLPVAPHLAIPT